MVPFDGFIVSKSECFCVNYQFVVAPLAKTPSRLFLPGIKAEAAIIPHNILKVCADLKNSTCKTTT